MSDNLLPEGFKDEVSKQAAIEHKYKNIIINLFQSNGYDLVKTPMIEYDESLKSENSLKIEVGKNKKKLAIRDDITMQVARLASARLSKKVRPLKLCYYGEVTRKEGSILRPERQFLQIGAECIGESSYKADIEMIELAYSALIAVGIKNISIELSSRVFLDKLYKKIHDKFDLEKIKSLIRKKDINNSLKLIKSSDHQYLKDIVSCTGNYSLKKQNLEKLKIDNENINEISNLNNIYNSFEKSCSNINFSIDLTEIEDKDYHNSIRFTIFADKVRGEIARGGRYISKNNTSTENATGFTCYMDTILRASSNIEKSLKILIPFSTTKEKRNELIEKKYIVETFFDDEKLIKDFALNKNYQFYLSNNKIFEVED